MEREIEVYMVPTAHLLEICIYPFCVCKMLTRNGFNAEDSEKVYLTSESTW